MHTHTHAQSEAVYFIHTLTHTHTQLQVFGVSFCCYFSFWLCQKCLFGFLCYLFYGTFCYTLFFVLLILVCLRAMERTKGRQLLGFASSI